MNCFGQLIKPLFLSRLRKVFAIGYDVAMTPRYLYRQRGCPNGMVNSLRPPAFRLIRTYTFRSSGDEAFGSAFGRSLLYALSDVDAKYDGGWTGSPQGPSWDHIAMRCLRLHVKSYRGTNLMATRE